MAVTIPTHLSTAIVSQADLPSPPPPGGSDGDRPPHVTAIAKLGGALSEEVKESLFSQVEEMEETGASFDDIKAFVDSELEANGVDLPAGQQRTGQLVDMMS